MYWCNYDDVIAATKPPASARCAKAASCGFMAGTAPAKSPCDINKDCRWPKRKEPTGGCSSTLWTRWPGPVPRAVRRRKLARSKSPHPRRQSRAASRCGWNCRWCSIGRCPWTATIRSASVICEKVGSRERWRLLVTVAQPERAARQGPAVAVDLGWRLLPEGLRAAYWEDEHGDHGQLLLEPAVLWQFSKLNDLKSIQDQHLLRRPGHFREPGRRPTRCRPGSI